MVDLTDARVFEVIVDSLETGVYLVDRHREIICWNHGNQPIIIKKKGGHGGHHGARGKSPTQISSPP